MGRREWDTNESRSISSGRWPTNGRIITITEVPPQKWAGPKPISGSPSWGFCTGKTSPQNIWPQWGLFSWELEGCGNRNSALKKQNCTCPKSQHTGNNLKGAWFRPTCWSWRASWLYCLGSRQLGLLLGHRSWQQPFWGAYSTTKSLVFQVPFWSPSSNLLALKLSLAHQWAAWLQGLATNCARDQPWIPVHPQ